ncbi:MAG: zinc ribbon domain-containing protein [Candidatus Thorarchaeota archaeon]|nr:MAG: zinc ribbon domain-containing protein [Candidatus Thorarchaeota archaeon]
MSERPGFLSVSVSGSGLSTMGHESKMIREKDVKFDGEDGSLEVTDIRIVWMKKPSRWGAVKKGALIGGAILGAAALASAGRGRGVGDALARGLSRGLAYAAIGVAISSWNQDSYYNKDKDGNTESIAIPVLAISNAQQTGNDLIVELKSGGHMRFSFRQKKVIPSVVANLTSAREQGKCPYCGARAGHAASCPNCGAPIDTGGAPTVGPAATGGGFCTNCGNPMDPGDRFCGKCGHRND